MTQVTVIKPKKGIIPINLKELYQYKELLFTFVLRDTKVKYRQTIIGVLWAILQPLLTMVVFSFFFGKIAKIPSEGVPYPIFSYSGLVLWIYFTNSITNASNSLINSSLLISKVYFPREILPISAVLTGILDYLMAAIIIFGFIIYYKFSLGTYIFLLPLILFFTSMLASGIGFFLSALNVKYRDVRYVLPFFIQLLVFVTPVIYPVSVTGKYKWLVTLNPMSGLIEAHRTVILGHKPVNWEMLGISILLTLAIFIIGAFYFKSVAKYFADLI